MLHTSLVAVPALSRVDPVSTSGPTTGSTQMSATARMASGGSVQAISTVRAPRSRARVSAPRTKGVVPDAAMPHTTSPVCTACASITAAPAAGSSSAPSIGVRNARSPPAMMPTTMAGSVPNVGGHSLASSTPSRPDVPAPTYNKRRPARNADSINAIAPAIGTRCDDTASATP